MLLTLELMGDGWVQVRRGLKVSAEGRQEDRQDSWGQADLWYPELCLILWEPVHKDSLHWRQEVEIRNQLSSQTGADEVIGSRWDGESGLHGHPRRIRQGQTQNYEKQEGESGIQTTQNTEGTAVTHIPLHFTHAALFKYPVNKSHWAESIITLTEKNAKHR